MANVGASGSDAINISGLLNPKKVRSPDLGVTRGSQILLLTPI